MKKPVWVLPMFLAVTLSAIYVLPRVGAVAESAINMELPRYAGNWSFYSLQPSEAEIKTLAPDTEFSKAVCSSPRAYEITEWGDLARDRIDLSIVLSGADINNSIHRPERCMPAQGHHDLVSTNRMLTLENKRIFAVKRMKSTQTVPLAPKEGESNTPPRYGEFHCLTYYFFVGHDRVTNDHLQRTLYDMKDRLVRGMDQRWAYVSVSMWYGRVPGIGPEVSEAEADEKLCNFLAGFSERQINWDQIKP